MRAAAVVVLVGLLAAACSGTDEGASDADQPSTSAHTPEAVVIRTKLTVAPTAGAEVVATGEVLEGSTLGDSPFCVGGAIKDLHANLDPEVEPLGLLARTITCPDGTVKVGFTPGQASGLKQAGTWTIASGTGAYEGLDGSGEFETTYDASDDALARETYTGTVTR
jgi:hypothetical protein